MGKRLTFCTSEQLQNEVECLRLKTKNYEMIVAPSGNFTMVAIQESLK